MMNDSSAREMNERQPQRLVVWAFSFSSLIGTIDFPRSCFQRNCFHQDSYYYIPLILIACLKQASKKFGGDEKQPKLRLIADENSGGFPNAKNNGMTNTRCESKREMKSPSLVARLMGLESLPAGSGSKPQKASASETWSNVADKLGARPGGSDKKDMDFEMGSL